MVPVVEIAQEILQGSEQESAEAAVLDISVGEELGANAARAEFLGQILGVLHGGGATFQIAKNRSAIQSAEVVQRMRGGLVAGIFRGILVASESDQVPARGAEDVGFTIFALVGWHAAWIPAHSYAWQGECRRGDFKAVTAGLTGMAG